MDEPVERATMPSGALFTRISSRNRQFERAFVRGFLEETSNSSEFPSQMLCGTSDDAERSFSCGILEETVASSNSAESVTVFWQNNSEFAERTSLWNEQRRPAECFPADFFQKLAIRATAPSKCQEQAIRANSRHEKRRRARAAFFAKRRKLRNERFAERATTPNGAFLRGFWASCKTGT